LNRSISKYAAQRTVIHDTPIVRLTDSEHDVEVSIVPSFGNRAFEMTVHGEDILYFPFPDVSAVKGLRDLNGIPFLAPWGNRMAGGGFWANGKRFSFNNDLGSLRLDKNGLPIHGMLTASPLWSVTDAAADATMAHVTSRFEFWKHPELMANWPFAHEYEMTYRLESGVLEVSTTITNRSSQPMPVAIGFHPYFILPGVERDEAVAQIPARLHVETDSRLIATGEFKPIQLPDRITLKEHRFDDGFTDLVRDAKGRAVFSVESKGRRIEVAFGPRYRVAVVYAPPGENYICFEPMTAITNGVNLAHEGKYPDLQTVAPGGQWHESFWIGTSGFRSSAAIDEQRA
jgi:aldose 1-epimerase